MALRSAEDDFVILLLSTVSVLLLPSASTVGVGLSMVEGGWRRVVSLEIVGYVG